MNNVIKKDPLPGINDTLSNWLKLKTFEDHLNNLEGVSKRLQVAQLILNIKKYQLLYNKANYLSHVVNKEGVAMDKKKVASIKQ